ncbi:hypothetical protein [Streptomyces palmae]|uniref:Hydrogenase maturation protease n=1 Tax=Streptomyces palmae TaxID=1701085 RepID=A0A4Z0HDJ8_9ACTN|nr:hypothetical protein [Streptomyces palmae]TGB18648.1 hypothetical protein E4099_01710 [Streptomyces palmae]
MTADRTPTRPAWERAVEKIARTCLYEGYVLWPYRRSALKNAKRWTFGGVFPTAVAEELGEPGTLRTEVLLDTGGRPAEVTVRVSFLHVVDRQVVREGEGGPEPVDELTVAGERHLTWQEATEHDLYVHLPPAAWAAGPYTRPIEVPGGTDREPLYDPAGRHAGTVVRSRQPLSGTVEIHALPVGEGLTRIAVHLTNTTPCPRPAAGERHARERAAVHAFVSTHTVLHCDTARFVSLLDPPERLRAAAAACDNQGTWPVLVAEAEAGPAAGGGGLAAPPRQDSRAGAHTVLSSPVTLYDFPAVAPESPGDLFDGTEIDKLLILGVLSLTEEERREARACDPRVRELLDRCAELGPAELGALHGTIREFRTLEDV